VRMVLHARACNTVVSIAATLSTQPTLIPNDGILLHEDRQKMEKMVGGP
jgi:hypothetical protein